MPGAAKVRLRTRTNTPDGDHEFTNGVSQLRRELLQLPLFIGIQRGVDQLTLKFPQARGRPIGALVSSGGQSHKPPAPVVGMRAARDQALRFEPVEHHRDVVRADREHLGELPRLLGIGSNARQKIEGVVLHQREPASPGDTLEQLGEIIADHHKLLAEGHDWRRRVLLGCGCVLVREDGLTDHRCSVRSPKSLIIE